MGFVLDNYLYDDGYKANSLLTQAMNNPNDAMNIYNDRREKFDTAIGDQLVSINEAKKNLIPGVDDDLINYFKGVENETYNIVDKLSREGWNSTINPALMRLKSANLDAKNLAERGTSLRDAEQKRIDEIKKNDPWSIIEFNPYEKSSMDFVRNPGLQSRHAEWKTIQDMIKSISNKWSTFKANHLYKPGIDPDMGLKDFLLYSTRNGIEPIEFARIMNGVTDGTLSQEDLDGLSEDAKAAAYLVNTIFTNEIKARGYDDWLNNEQMNRLLMASMAGWHDAIGTYSPQLQQLKQEAASRGLSGSGSKKTYVGAVDANIVRPLTSNLDINNLATMILQLSKWTDPLYSKRKLTNDEKLERRAMFENIRKAELSKHPDNEAIKQKNNAFISGIENGTIALSPESIKQHLRDVAGFQDAAHADETLDDYVNRFITKDMFVRPNFVGSQYSSSNKNYYNLIHSIVTEALGVNGDRSNIIFYRNGDITNPKMLEDSDLKVLNGDDELEDMVLDDIQVSQTGWGPNSNLLVYIKDQKGHTHGFIIPRSSYGIVDDNGFLDAMRDLGLEYQSAYADWLLNQNDNIYKDIYDAKRIAFNTHLTNFDKNAAHRTNDAITGRQDDALDIMKRGEEAKAKQKEAGK